MCVISVCMYVHVLMCHGLTVGGCTHISAPSLRQRSPSRVFSLNNVFLTLGCNDTKKVLFSAAEI